MGKEREQRMIDHLDAKRRGILSSMLNALIEHREARQEKRMMAGMAELKSQRTLVSRYFAAFKEMTVAIIDKKSRQRAKAAKVKSHLGRRRLLKMWCAL